MQSGPVLQIGPKLLQSIFQSNGATPPIGFRYLPPMIAIGPYALRFPLRAT
jgi:hypothetical protein